MAQGAINELPDQRSAVRATLRLVVDRPAQLANFRRELRALLLERGLVEGEREAIVLAAVEALSNALQVCEDANCRIEVLVSLVADYVCVEVRDAAQGFKGVCLDLEVPEACEEHGRGLYLMRTLMQSLEVVPRPRGTLVRMVKRLEAEGHRGESDELAC